MGVGGLFHGGVDLVLGGTPGGGLELGNELLELGDVLVFAGNEGGEVAFFSSKGLFAMGDFTFALYDGGFVGFELGEPGKSKEIVR